MVQQIELFHVNCPENYFPLRQGWFIDACDKSTAESQGLVFEIEGIGHSRWMIDAIDRTVIFLSGDQEIRPSAQIIEEASSVLIEMTKTGLLFPMPLNEVIFSKVWQKGYE